MSYTSVDTGYLTPLETLSSTFLFLPADTLRSPQKAMANAALTFFKVWMWIMALVELPTIFFLTIGVGQQSLNDSLPFFGEVGNSRGVTEAGMCIAYMATALAILRAACAMSPRNLALITVSAALHLMEVPLFTALYFKNCFHEPNNSANVPRHGILGVIYVNACVAFLFAVYQFGKQTEEKVAKRK